MTKVQLLDYYKQFPAVLKNLLLTENVIFPPNIEYDYEPITAYRGVTREKGDSTKFNRNDMRSYFEESRKPRGINYSEHDPSRFAVSLFESSEMLSQCLKFPRPNKKIAKGYVYKEGGPRSMGRNSHIDWWLFEGADITCFEILENNDE